ncbi:hypothetical protein pb186bvf_020635 [Paramecium bursaria]
MYKNSQQKTIWPRPDIFAIVHHILMIIFLYVMHRTAYESPGHPDPIIQNTDPYAQLRSCKYCQVFKPPRCHHCRQCNKCILRMDHHCPWINNCIGKNNYKYFISMVTISSKFYINQAIMSICYSIGMFRRVLIYNFGQYDVYFIIFSLAVSTTMGIMITIFLGYHIMYILFEQSQQGLLLQTRRHLNILNIKEHGTIRVVGKIHKKCYHDYILFYIQQNFISILFVKCINQVKITPQSKLRNQNFITQRVLEDFIQNLIPLEQYKHVKSQEQIQRYQISSIEQNQLQRDEEEFRANDVGEEIIQLRYQHYLGRTHQLFTEVNQRRKEIIQQNRQRLLQSNTILDKEQEKILIIQCQKEYRRNDSPNHYDSIEGRYTRQKNQKIVIQLDNLEREAQIKISEDAKRLDILDKLKMKDQQVLEITLKIQQDRKQKKLQRQHSGSKMEDSQERRLQNDSKVNKFLQMNSQDMHKMKIQKHKTDEQKNKREKVLKQKEKLEKLDSSSQGKELTKLQIKLHNSEELHKLSLKSKIERIKDHYQKEQELISKHRGENERNSQEYLNSVISRMVTKEQGFKNQLEQIIINDQKKKHQQKDRQNKIKLNQEELYKDQDQKLKELNDKFQRMEELNRIRKQEQEKKIMLKQELRRLKEQDKIQNYERQKRQNDYKMSNLYEKSRMIEEKNRQKYLQQFQQQQTSMEINKQEIMERQRVYSQLQQLSDTLFTYKSSSHHNPKEINQIKMKSLKLLRGITQNQPEQEKIVLSLFQPKVSLSARKTAPNIGLIKYWGKWNEEEIIPLNTNIGVTLDSQTVYTETEIKLIPNHEDQIKINGIQYPINKRVSRVFGLFRTLFKDTYHLPLSLYDPNVDHNMSVSNVIKDIGKVGIVVNSHNSFPTGSGLASSSSGFSALALCLGDIIKNENFKVGQVSRIGSGSACRCLYGDLVEFQGVNKVYLDAEQTPEIIQQQSQVCVPKHIEESIWLRDITKIVIVTDVYQGKKEVLSTDGMRSTWETSKLIQARVREYADIHRDELMKALRSQNFNSLMEVIMKDSNQFHATCMDTYPPLFYLNDFSRQIIHLVHKYNRDNLDHVGYTFDAGSHAVLLMKDSSNFMEYLNNHNNKDVLRKQFTLGNIFQTKIGTGPIKLS